MNKLLHLIESAADRLSAYRRTSHNLSQLIEATASRLCRDRQYGSAQLRIATGCIRRFLKSQETKFSGAKKRRSIAWGNGVENIGHRDISTFLQTIDGDGCAEYGALRTRFIFGKVVIASQWNCCPFPITSLELHTWRIEIGNK